MKRKKINIIASFAIFISISIMFACSDSYLGLEKIQTESKPPEKVNVTKVIPKPGALEIQFSLSKGDTDIAQVVASYINKKGKEVQFSVSRYVSSIMVEGLMGTDEVSVKLYGVDNSGNESEVTIVEGSPLISPVEYARGSMKVEPAFGGVKISWKNISGDFLAIHVLTNDTLQVKGDTTFIEDPDKRIYTRDTVVANTFAYVRQYPDKEQTFGFTITDKWGNRSDTLIGNFTPFREDVVDYNHIDALNVFNFRYTSGRSLDYETEGVDLATGVQYDGLFHRSNLGPHTLFNGQATGANEFHCTMFTRNLHNPDVSTHELIRPAFATYNLNVDVKLSRMKVHWRHDPAQIFNGPSVKSFRFWGTDDKNDDRYIKFPEGWTLIGEYVGKDAIDKMSLTSEELAQWKNGIEFDIVDDNVNPSASPSTNFRYLRIEMIDNYDNSRMIYTWNEIFLWGQIENKYYE